MYIFLIRNIQVAPILTCGVLICSQHI